MISFEALRDVCSQIHAVMAADVFGKTGVDAIFEIMETLRELYRHVEPMRVKGALIVFRPVVDVDRMESSSTVQPCGEFDLLTHKAEEGIILEIRADGQKYIHSTTSATPTDLATTAVVYEYRNGQEHFLAGPHQKQVLRLDKTALSQFCGHTFFTLGDALRRYAETHVRQTSCLILEPMWADENRLFLKPKPELYMRRSLTQFLKVSLGAGYEVRPEQNMDESHPVDIKVTKMLSNRLMIIEIKWLGDSRNLAGEMGTSYRDARAKEGAQQLADYLDQNKVQAPLNITQGYYVIIDARRHGLNAKSKTIDRDDGLHYASKEIAFDPEFYKIRNDFDPPYRMFAEPKFLS